MKRLIYTILILIIATVFFHHHSQGKVIEISLEKMTSTSGKIFTGKCMEVRKTFHPKYKNIKVTIVEFNVLDNIKGNEGNSLDVMFFGHSREMPQIAKLGKGDTVLLFLYPESQYGFTSLVGGDQGRFLVKVDELSGKPIFVNTLNKENLFKGLEIKTVEKIDGISVLKKGYEFVDYEMFKQVVQSIMNRLENGEANK